MQNLLLKKNILHKIIIFFWQDLKCASSGQAKSSSGHLSASVVYTLEFLQKKSKKMPNCLI